MAKIGFMGKFGVCFFLFLFTLFSGFFCCSAENGEIVVGLDVNFQPMGFLQNGEIVGFDIDLFKAVAENMGKKVRFQPIDWDSKELELNSGKIDVICNGLSYTDSRAESMSLTKSYMLNKQIIVVSGNASIRNFEDLAGKRVCGQRGSSGVDSFKKSSVSSVVEDFVELENLIDCLLEVRNGVSHGAVVDEAVAKYYINKNSLQDDFKILDEVLSTEYYVMAVKKGNVELKSEIESSLENLNRSNRLQDISKKWFDADLINLNEVARLSSSESEKIFSKTVFFEVACGLKTSLLLFFVCLIFSVILGLLICFIRAANLRLVNFFIWIYIYIMRGTPLLLQLFFAFYGIPCLLPNFDFSNRFLVGVVVFILNYAAYFAEIFRGGLNGITRLQFENIEVLQIPKVKAIVRIVIPQMFRVCFPAICNETVTLVKDTPLIYAIGVLEFLTVTKNLVNRTADITAYLVAGVVYLVICSLINILFRILEKKFKYV